MEASYQDSIRRLDVLFERAETWSATGDFGPDAQQLDEGLARLDPRVFAKRTACLRRARSARANAAFADMLAWTEKADQLATSEPTRTERRRARRMRDAAAELEESLAAIDDWQIYLGAAKQLVEDDRPEAALVAYLLGQRRFPNNELLLNGAVKPLRSLGEPLDGAHLARRSIALIASPADNFVGHTMLGWCLWDLGQNAAAAARAQAVLAERPRDEYALVLAVESHWRINRENGAAWAAEGARRLPGVPWFWERLGGIRRAAIADCDEPLRRHGERLASELGGWPQLHAASSGGSPAR